MFRFSPSIIPGVVWLVVSIILLTIPGTAFPKENWFDKIWIDKWVHVGMFAILAALWCWGLLRYRRGTKRSFIFVTLGAFLFGIAMEVVQHYWIPNRSFDVGDIIADGVGSLAGFGFSVWRYIKK